LWHCKATGKLTANEHGGLSAVRPATLVVVPPHQPVEHFYPPRRVDQDIRAVSHLSSKVERIWRRFEGKHKRFELGPGLDKEGKSMR
ncbi:MAG: hypothetical protein ACYSWU_23490, partial [Planctomycetota bacterium]